MEYIVAVLVVLTIIMLVVMSIKMINDRQYLQNQMQKQLLDFQSSIIQAVHSDLHTLNENTSDTLFKMEHSVHNQLYANLEVTNKAFQEVLKQMVHLDESHRQLKILSEDISNLHRIFNDKKTRGMYGEVELYTILENTFGVDSLRYAKQYKLSNGTIVDAVIFASDSLGTISIDAKFPLENYLRLQEGEASEHLFKQDIKRHIQAIASKYLIANETSEFAYMFIPAEAIFAYIYAHFPDLVQYSYQQRVYLVSPTTLMAYSTAIQALYLGQRKNEKMRDIQHELVLLAQEFDRFEKRLEIVSKDYEKNYKDMKDIQITAHKIIKKFKVIDQVEWD